VVSDTSVKLDWASPGDADFTGVMIRRAEGATAPLDSHRRDRGPHDRDRDETGVTFGAVYSYALFAHDGAHSCAAADVIAGTAPTAAVLWISSSGIDTR
jgi:hypothetical protein